MLETIRVPIARFKYNMRPHIEAAKAGETVIVTLNGIDEFKVVPCHLAKPRPLPKGCVPWCNPDSDEPAFPPLNDESAP